jgi:glycosyltransferase involved in cell wall biosynthesis
VFVPPGDAPALADALIRLANDRATCARMGARAREFVLRRFNRKDQAQSFCALLEGCTIEAAA